MLLLTIKGQYREREISRYFLIQRRSKRVKVGARKGRGVGLCEEEISDLGSLRWLSRRRGHGGSDNPETWFVPAALAGELSWGLS